MKFLVDGLAGTHEMRELDDPLTAIDHIHIQFANGRNRDNAVRFHVAQLYQRMVHHSNQFQVLDDIVHDTVTGMDYMAGERDITNSTVGYVCGCKFNRSSSYSARRVDVMLNRVSLGLNDAECRLLATQIVRMCRVALTNHRGATDMHQYRTFINSQQPE
jgi:hypothetical protein